MVSALTEALTDNQREKQTAVDKRGDDFFWKKRGGGEGFFRLKMGPRYPVNFDWSLKDFLEMHPGSFCDDNL